MNRRTAIAAVLIAAFSFLGSAPRAWAMYQPGTGRFHTVDSYEGTSSDPKTLHKYLYAHADPVNHTDPSGQFSIMQVLVVTALAVPVIVIPATEFMDTRQLRNVHGVTNPKQVDRTTGVLADALTMLEDFGQVRAASRIKGIRLYSSKTLYDLRGREADMLTWTPWYRPDFIVMREDLLTSPSGTDENRYRHTVFVASALLHESVHAFEQGFTGTKLSTEASYEGAAYSAQLSWLQHLRDAEPRTRRELITEVIADVEDRSRRAIH